MPTPTTPVDLTPDEFDALTASVGGSGPSRDERHLLRRAIVSHGNSVRAADLQERTRAEAQMSPEQLKRMFLAGEQFASPASMDVLANAESQDVAFGGSSTGTSGVVRGVAASAKGLSGLTMRAGQLGSYAVDIGSFGFLSGQGIRDTLGDTADRISRENALAGAAYTRRNELEGHYDPAGIRGATPGVMRSLTDVATGRSLASLAGLTNARAVSDTIVGLQAANTANDSYTMAKDSGRTTVEAALYAGRAGVVEGLVAAVFNRIPGAAGLESMEPIKASAKALLKEYGGELAEEEITSVLGMVNDKMSKIDTTGWSAEQTWGVVKDTWLQTTLAMGLARAPQTIGSLRPKQGAQGLLDGATQQADARRQQAQDQAMAEYAQKLREFHASPEAQDPVPTDTLGLAPGEQGLTAADLYGPRPPAMDPYDDVEISPEESAAAEAELDRLDEVLRMQNAEQDPIVETQDFTPEVETQDFTPEVVPQAVEPVVQEAPQAVVQEAPQAAAQADPVAEFLATVPAADQVIAQEAVQLAVAEGALNNQPDPQALRNTLAQYVVIAKSRAEKAARKAAKPAAAPVAPTAPVETAPAKPEPKAVAVQAQEARARGDYVEVTLEDGTRGVITYDDAEAQAFAVQTADGETIDVPYDSVQSIAASPKAAVEKARGDKSVRDILTAPAGKSKKSVGETVERVGHGHVIAKTKGGTYVVGQLPRLNPARAARGQAIARVVDITQHATIEAARAAATAADAKLGVKEDQLGPARKLPAGYGEAKLVTGDVDVGTGGEVVRGTTEDGTPEKLSRVKDERTRPEKIVDAALALADQEPATSQEVLALLATAEHAKDAETKAKLFEQAEQKLKIHTKAGRAAARAAERGVDIIETSRPATEKPQPTGAVSADKLLGLMANSAAPAVQSDLSPTLAPKAWRDNLYDLKKDIHQQVDTVVGSGPAVVMSTLFDLDSHGADGKIVAKDPKSALDLAEWTEAARRIQNKILDSMPEVASKAAEQARLRFAVDPFPRVGQTGTDTDTDGAKARRADDGLTPAQRLEALNVLARTLKLNLVHHDSPLTYKPDPDGSAYPVAAMVDLPTSTVHLGPVASLQDGVMTLAHESVHAELAAMAPEDRAAVLAAVASAFASPEAAAAAVTSVQQTWGKLLDPKNATVAAYEEMAADAGAAALITDHHSILKLLPPGLAGRVAGMLVRIGKSISAMVRSLAGMKSQPAQQARTELMDIAERLLRARIERVDPRVPAMVEGLADLVLDPVEQLDVDAILGMDLDQVSADGEKRGDMFAAIRAVVAKIPGLRGRDGAAKNIQAFAAAISAQSYHEARKHPDLAYAMRGADQAERAFHALLKGAVDLRSEFHALDPANQAQALKAAYDIRLYELDQLRTGSPVDHARIQRKMAGLPPTLQSAVHALWASNRALFDAQRTALSSALGFATPLSLPQVKVRQAQIHTLLSRAAAGAQVGDIRQELARLDAWESLETAFAKATSNYYMPLRRIDRDNSIEVKVGGKVTHRESANEADTADKVTDLQAQFPGADVQVYPSGQAEGVSRQAMDTVSKAMETALAARNMPTADRAALQALIADVLPALMVDDFASSMMHARGTPGFDVHPQVLSEHLNAIAYGVKRALTHAYAGAAVTRIAQDRARPVLAKFARDTIYGVPETTDPVLAASIRVAGAITYARVMAKPVLAAANLVTSYVSVPFHLGGMAGTTGKAAVLSFMKTSQGIARLAARLPFESAKAIMGKESSLVAAAAAGEKPVLAAAILEAERSGLFGSTEVARQIEETQGSSFVAKIARGVTFLDAMTNRVARIATFITAHRLADGFTAKDWARLKEREGYHGPAKSGDFATWATHYTQGQYGKKFRPPAFRGPAGTAVYQFASFVVNQTVIYKDMIRRSMEKGNRVQGLAALVALNASGTMLFGVAQGAPIFGKIAELIAGAFLDDEDVDAWLARMAEQARRDGDHAEAAIWNIVRGGLPEALAKSRNTAASFVGERATAVLESSAPAALALQLFAHPRVPVYRTGEQIAEGVIDIKTGAKEGNKDSVVRGFARIVGPMGLGPVQALDVAKGDGLTAPAIAEPGKSSPTVVGDGQLTGLDKLGVYLDAAMGAQTYKSKAAIKEYQAKSSAQNADQLPVDNLVDAVAADIVHQRDPRESMQALSAYVRQRVAKLHAADTELERARVLAELGWILGKDPGKQLEGRILGAVLRRKFGNAIPPGVRGGPAANMAPYQQAMHDAYSGSDAVDEVFEGDPD